MRRREFITLLGGATLARTVSARAQQIERVRRILVLMGGAENDPNGQAATVAFRQGLQQLGWTDGQNIRIDYRWAAGQPDRASVYATELAALAPDIILANGTQVLAALQRVTRSIPIVFVVVADPVGGGFIQDVARPGGNITGFSTFEPQIGGKWLELLREIAPRASRGGVLTDPDFRGFSELSQTIETMAPGFGLRAVAVHGRNSEDIGKNIEDFARQENGALIALPTPATSVNRAQIFALATRYRLPAIYPFSFLARSGGLLSYGFDSVDLFKRARTYVAPLLNGQTAR